MYNEYMKYGLEFFIIIFPVCIAISYLLMWLRTKENKEEVKDFILFGKPKPYTKSESYMSTFRLWTIVASIFWVGNSIYIAIFGYLG
ncbi:MAG: hypothetical protein CL907_02940 [Dehalococcoidia bacterium]|nr:hypothetical protein [Dehalococcoidia bacterium]